MYADNVWAAATHPAEYHLNIALAVGVPLLIVWELVLAVILQHGILFAATRVSMVTKTQRAPYIQLENNVAHGQVDGIWLVDNVVPVAGTERVVESDSGVLGRPLDLSTRVKRSREHGECERSVGPVGA